ncbi:MAG TPA: hypothetical protein VGO93_01405 [Candidatus Xenobia bacterium]|jgi:hypothetical protein
MKRWVAVVVGSLLLMGCDKFKQTAPGPGQKRVHIEIRNTDDAHKGGKVSCMLKVGDPQHAGMATGSFDVTMPGTKDLFCGPSEYDLIMMPWNTHFMALTITVDGHPLTRGAELVMDDEKGEAMFEIKRDSQ